MPFHIKSGLSDVIQILTVGDGDLTLSLALSRAYGSQIALTASTLLDTKEELIQTYHNSQNVLHELAELDVVVWFGVDATQLHRLPNKVRFDYVLFHHPHLGLDSLLENEKWHAQRHYILLAHYLWSAQHILTDKGKVHLCLCGTQSQTWKVEEAATRQGLELLTKESTSTPMHTWLSPTFVVLPVKPHFPAPRKFRNGKLGSKHSLGKYGYQHRRTHGDAHDGGDVCVQGSVHLVFGKTNHPEPASGSNISECNICGVIYNSREPLQKHLHSPALPDTLPSRVDATRKKVTAICLQVSSHDDEEVTNIKDDEDKARTISNEVTKIPSSATVQYQAIVANDHDGKRLRWYLRQLTVKITMHGSKKQCDDLIKEGRVSVNSQVVTDSSRILSSGDVVMVLEKVTNPSNMTSKQSSVDVIFQHHSLVVAFKPVGMRTIGSFSETTLEMTVSSHVGASYKSVTKLDTGCSGLCVLKLHNTCDVKVTHVFTALVHGCVPDQWNKHTNFDLPVENLRRWKKNSGDKRSMNEISHDDSPLETLVLRCVERTTFLSTLQIEITSKSAGLCSTICFFLRKKGHPVVNDRFCKQEYLELPRSMRNTIKGQLSIGCYEVKILGINEKIRTKVPERLSAGHWEQHVKNATEGSSVALPQM